MSNLIETNNISVSKGEISNLNKLLGSSKEDLKYLEDFIIDGEITQKEMEILQGILEKYKINKQLCKTKIVSNREFAGYYGPLGRKRRHFVGPFCHKRYRNTQREVTEINESVIEDLREVLLNKKSDLEKEIERTKEKLEQYRKKMEGELKAEQKNSKKLQEDNRRLQQQLDEAKKSKPVYGPEKPKFKPLNFPDLPGMGESSPTPLITIKPESRESNIDIRKIEDFEKFISKIEGKIEAFEEDKSKEQEAKDNLLQQIDKKIAEVGKDTEYGKRLQELRGRLENTQVELENKPENSGEGGKEKEEDYIWKILAVLGIGVGFVGISIGVHNYFRSLKFKKDLDEKTKKLVKDKENFEKAQKKIQELERQIVENKTLNEEEKNNLQEQLNYVKEELEQAKEAQEKFESSERVRKAIAKQLFGEGNEDKSWEEISKKTTEASEQLSQKIKEMKELSEKLKSDYEKATNDSKAELEKQFSETKNKLEKLYEEAKKQLDLREIALQTREQEFESKIKAFEERGTTLSEDEKQELEKLKKELEQLKQQLQKNEKEAMNENKINGLDSLKTELEQKGFKLVEDISYIRLAETKNNGEEIYKKGQSTIIDYIGRKIILVEVNGVHMPFYLSTGDGGKVDAPPGKWYPFFGIEKDWLNKTHGKEMSDYYGNTKLREVAGILDRNIGDVRGNNDFPKVLPEGKHLDIINRDMTPSNKSDEEGVRKNIKQALEKIEAKNSAEYIREIEELKIKNTELEKAKNNLEKLYEKAKNQLEQQKADFEDQKKILEEQFKQREIALQEKYTQDLTKTKEEWEKKSADKKAKTQKEHEAKIKELTTNFETENKKLTDEKAEAEKKLNEEINTNEDLRKKIFDKENMIENLTKSLNKTKLELDKAISTIKAKQEIIDNLNKEISNLNTRYQTEIENLTKKHNEELNKEKDVAKKLQDELDGLHEKDKTLEEQSQKYKDKLEELQTQLKKAQDVEIRGANEIADLKKQHKTEIERITNELNSKKVEVASLQERLDKVKKDFDKFNQEKDNLEQENKKITEELEKAKGRIEDLNKRQKEFDFTYDKIEETKLKGQGELNFESKSKVEVPQYTPAVPENKFDVNRKELFKKYSNQFHEITIGSEKFMGIVLEIPTGEKIILKNNDGKQEIVNLNGKHWSAKILDLEKITPSQVVKVENREISSDFDELDNKSEELGLEWKKPLEKIKIKDFDSFKKFMTQAGSFRIASARKGEFEKLVKEKINSYLEGKFSDLRNSNQIREVFELISVRIKDFEGREIKEFRKKIEGIKQIFNSKEFNIGKGLDELKRSGLDIKLGSNGKIEKVIVKELKLPIR